MMFRSDPLAMNVPPIPTRASLARVMCTGVALALCVVAGAAQAQAPAAAPARPQSRQQSVDPSIVAIVNGEIVSMGDGDWRRRPC